jgi:hypothetical protein
MTSYATFHDFDDHGMLNATLFLPAKASRRITGHVVVT